MTNSRIVLTLTFLLLASQALGKDVKSRIALVAVKAFDLDKSPLVSLLEVELSKNKDIELLERGEIDRILREQQISAARLVQRDKAVKVGQLLRVDAFLLLSAEAMADEEQKESKLLRVRLVETAHGLRLLDSFESLDRTKLEDSAKRITENVVAIADKLALPAGEAIPVGIVDIHRVELGERYQMLARALPRMLSARLNKEPRIIMLEREDLKLLYDEKLLTQGKDAKFWSSGVLIDGRIEPKGRGDLELKLRLRRATGKETATFALAVEPSKPLEVVKEAAARIIRELMNAPPSSAWQPEQEAGEFFHLAQLLKAHGRREKAVKLFETAYALAPEDVRYTGALLGNASFYSDLELADIVSLLVRQIQAGYEGGSVSADDVLYRWGKSFGPVGCIGRLPGMGYFVRSESVATEEIKSINRENRRIWAETASKAIMEDPDRNARMLIPLACASSDVPEEVMANLRKVCLKYDAVILKMPVSPQHSHLIHASKRFEKLWRQHLQELTQSADPVVRCRACLALASRHDRAYFEKAIEILRKDLKTPNEPLSAKRRKSPDWRIYWKGHDITKEELRNQIKSCMLNTLEKDEMVGILESLYEPLIETGDAENLFLWNPTYPLLHHRLFPFSPQGARRYVQLLEKVAGVLQTRKDHKEIRTVLNEIKDCQAAIRHRFREMEPIDKSVELGVIMLVKKKDWEHPTGFLFPHRHKIRVVLDGDTFWVAFAAAQGRRLQLVGINLAAKKVTTLWETQVPPRQRSLSMAGVSGMAIGREKIYVAVHGVGLIEFPRTAPRGKTFLDSPKILTDHDGLPSVFISGMVGDGDKLWIAYGGTERESGLGIYDPNTGHWERVFHSMLTGKKPLSSGKPYMLFDLVLPLKDKLFCHGDRHGLWRMVNTKSKKLKRLMGGYWPLEGQIWYCRQKIWIRGRGALIQFDPVSEEAKLVFGEEWWIKRLRKSNRQDSLFIPLSSMKSLAYGTFAAGKLDLSTSAVCGNQLWARSSQTQLMVIHRGKPLEEAEIIDNNILNGGKVLVFYSTPYGLIAVGEGTVGLIEIKDTEK